MATSHGSPPLAPVTLKFSVESKYTYLKTEEDQEVGGWGKPEGKATSKGRAKPRGRKCTAMAQLRMPAAYIRWPTADLPVNSDY